MFMRTFTKRGPERRNVASNVPLLHRRIEPNVLHHIVLGQYVAAVLYEQ
jgi:hypothetical protein